MQENMVVLHCLKGVGCDSVRTANTSANKRLKHQWGKKKNEQNSFLERESDFIFIPTKLKICISKYLQ